MIKDKDWLFRAITEKISQTDFVGFPFYYPPIFVWHKANQEEIKTAWKRTINRGVDKVGMYVHLPFCASRCIFCRFPAQKLKNHSQIDNYLNLLAREVKLYSKIFKSVSFRSLYVGGGTPSLLSPTQLEKFFELIYNHFDFKKCIQVVFEANPSTLSWKKLKLLKRYKVSRLNMGVQSFDDKLMKKWGRLSSEKSVYKAYQRARRAGIKYINFDIMCGLPGQTLKSFKETMKKVIKLSPDVVHVNPFFPNPATSFSQQGKVLSREEMQKREEMNALGRKMLLDSSYKFLQFEDIGKSNEARNIQIADTVEYNSPFLGLGMAAMSHISGWGNYMNFPDLEKYERGIRQNESPVYLQCRYKNKIEEIKWYVINSLRYNLLPKKRIYQLFGQDIDKVLKEEIEYLVKRGKIIARPTHLQSKVPNFGAYLVFSKYFYSEEIVKKCQKKIKPVKNKKKIIGDEELKYIPL